MTFEVKFECYVVRCYAEFRSAIVLERTVTTLRLLQTIL